MLYIKNREIWLAFVYIPLGLGEEKLSEVRNVGSTTVSYTNWGCNEQCDADMALSRSIAVLRTTST
jgi:hypothetical protein